MTLILLLCACFVCSQPAPVDGPTPPVEPPIEEPAGAAAPLSITSPLAGAVLKPGPITVTGQASVWEGQFELVLRAGEEELLRQHMDIEAGAPGRGEWSTTLDLPAGHAGPGVIFVYAQSPKDGAPMHGVEVAVTLE